MPSNLSFLKIIEFVCPDMPAKRARIEPTEKNPIPPTEVESLPLPVAAEPLPAATIQNHFSVWEESYRVKEHFIRIVGWKNNGRCYLSVLKFIKTIIKEGNYIDRISRPLLPDEIDFIKKLKTRRLREIFETEIDWEKQNACEFADIPRLIQDNPNTLGKFLSGPMYSIVGK
jgi:hypothetical protein